jgi:radical SAM/Cys-rich protein
MNSLGLPPLAASGLSVLQLNIGRLCNQTCAHCHVDAGPDRREIMSRPTMENCLRVLQDSDIPTVDITGGAPELNPNFRWLVERCRQLQRHVIDRCNLTVLTLPSQHGLVDFLARHQVEIVASLPCYQEEATDRQRGQGVFAKSIAAMKLLNRRGYGRPDSGLILNLVTNPVGASLPPPQEALEQTVRAELERRFGITFNHLYTITNLPISRFLEDLLTSGSYNSYMEQLVQAFNPATVDGLMCRTMISVSWDGRLFDCDFNQMLDLEVNHGAPARLADFNPTALASRRIVTGRHCYGCTAGSGSSCSGSLT